MARQLAVRNRKHTNGFEHCDQAELAFPADRRPVLDPLVVIRERLRPVALQLRHNVAMDHEGPSEDARKGPGLHGRGTANDLGRPDMVPPHRCRTGDGGT
jgi:hypothetical protein